MTRVSVLLPTYRPGALAERAIESVLSQQTDADLEIVVVDDGSGDGTADRLRSQFPSVRVIEQANQGTAAARNTALRHATGEYVALLDQDDEWDADKIARQLHHFGDPAVGMVHAGGRFRNELGAVTSVEHAVEPLDVHDLMAWCWVIQSSAVIRTSLLRELGGFDELLSAADDWDLWIRLAATTRLACEQAPLVTVLVHEGNQSNDAERMYRSAAGVIAKHRRLHSGCPHCTAASRRADLRNRQEYYRRLREQARRERDAGRHLASAMLTLRGLARHPRAPLETVRHHWRSRRHSTRLGGRGN